MRVAILHDYLNQLGGAERVLETLFEIFPSADFFTLVYDKERAGGMLADKKMKTSFLDYKFIRRHHRLFLPFMPYAAGKLAVRNESDYELIISSTAGYAKGFKIHRGFRHQEPFHISYCHSPLRYAWEIDYLKDMPVTPWPLTKSFFHPIAEKLKEWDKKASLAVNLFIANSNFIAEKIKVYYGREAQVIYPPVDVNFFYPVPAFSPNYYFLAVGRLLYYKRFDLVIEAFNALKKPLKIVGAGPEINKLKKMARTPYIEFLGRVTDSELRYLYSNATALIFPQVEDFGLAAAEAAACGLPVLAYSQGGAKEIIKDRETGLLFNEQNAASIVDAVREFETLQFDKRKIRRQAMKFSKENFLGEFAKTLQNSGFKI